MLPTSLDQQLGLRAVALTKSGKQLVLRAEYPPTHFIKSIYLEYFSWAFDLLKSLESLHKHCQRLC